MQLVGANPNAPARGLDRLPGRSNYFIGSDPNKWHIDVPSYGKVKFDNVYPGVDLVYYGKQRQLEYDFVVAPGADPGSITLDLQAAGSALEARNSKLAGAQSKSQNLKSRIDRDGDLVVEIAGDEVRFHKPVVYQPVGGSGLQAPAFAVPNPKSKIQNPRLMDGQYVLKGNNRVSFKIGGYDHTRPLVIDPVLVYLTYLGGTKDDLDEAIAIDSSGNAYITGLTLSTNFPTNSGAFQTTCKSSTTAACSQDAFVTKIKADGSALVYSTYLGGSATDSGYAIAVDGSGNAYVAGQTYSTDFPTTTGALQPTCGGYVTTPSPSCPAADAFVTELNPSGSALVYSTYLGGTSTDQANAIAVDTSGNAYVTGQTSSNDFPTTADALHKSFGGPSNLSDAFVTKLSFAASKLTPAYSTYLGGSNDDQGRAIVLDSSGNAYVAGLTNSLNFPVAAGAAGTFQGTLGGGYDGFVAKVDPAGKTLVYSTYLGGSSDDALNGIAVDGSGHAYVTGFTNSCTPGVSGCPSGATSFPLANPVELTAGTDGALVNYDGSKYAGNQDAFISRLGALGCGLTFSTYLGGKVTDSGVGITLDPSGDAYAVGQTNSNDFPTVKSYQVATGGGYDAFITKATPATLRPHAFILVISPRLRNSPFPVNWSVPRALRGP